MSGKGHFKPIAMDPKALFDHFSNGQPIIPISGFIDMLEKNGFQEKGDPRWSSIFSQLRKIERLDFESFREILGSKLSLLMRLALEELVIPDFTDFASELERIFEEVKEHKGGAQATYIPLLAKVNPEKFGFSVCSIDGQRFSLGDSDEAFCVQSCSKPITYAIALETVGADYVHQHVDKEASGQAFNSITLTAEGKPYNPMVNQGAIMMCSLVERKADPADRFDTVMKWWARLAGGNKPGFSNPTYLSERLTADRNFALAYLMRDRKCFPPETDIVQVLEFYFQCCSIEMTCDSLAVVASTLANGGICPLTGERVLSSETVRAVLSLMYSCGMYDYSGQFAFTIGLPAKSGVSGSIMLVVPNVCGICIWSPRLDKYGNSVRGIEFCKRLCASFNFHNFDNIVNSDSTGKTDPRSHKRYSKHAFITSFFYGCMEGDLAGVSRMVLSGLNVNQADYDLRTGLHIAAAEGHLHLVKYLVEEGANPTSRDRFGNLPLDDAVRHGHAEVVEFLQERMRAVQTSGTELPPSVTPKTRRFSIVASPSGTAGPMSPTSSISSSSSSSSSGGPGAATPTVRFTRALSSPGGAAVPPSPAFSASISGSLQGEAPPALAPAPVAV